MVRVRLPFFSAMVVFNICFFAMLLSCKSERRNSSHPEISNSDIEDGKQLAAIYCQSCHALPDPSLLDSRTWETGVLPVMGPRLGIFSFKRRNYPFVRDMSFSKSFYPSKPVVKEDEWQKIINYYIAAAPDTLTDQRKADAHISNSLPLFSAKEPKYIGNSPATTMVKILASKAGSFILVSDSKNRCLYRYNKDLQKVDSLKTTGALVDVEIENDTMLSCNIGILNPNTGKYGSGMLIKKNSSGKLVNDSTVLFKELERPVQISKADLNNDGRSDYLVCEFGFLTGALSWMENKGNGKFNRHVLRPLPGAIKACFQDYNHDGLMDIWVLFAQGEEGIFLYTNKGNGQFEQKEVLRFPPVYGSSYFEFADFNKDGHPDIVYTCGDNADYSIVLKPYHGVYIFMNDGKNNFKQQYFFHINGCYKAIARDFDNDGDLDIATISFFAEYVNKPEEGFVYLENTGGFNFSPYSLPQTQRGRWLTMEAGDVNGDGNLDLILGNFSIGPTKVKPAFDWKDGPPFLLLKNMGKKHL